MRPRENAASTLNHSDRHHAHSDDHSIFEKNQEVGLGEQNLELIEREALGDDPWVGRHMRDFGIALERGNDHVIGR